MSLKHTASEYHILQRLCLYLLCDLITPQRASHINIHLDYKHLHLISASN